MLHKLHREIKKKQFDSKLWSSGIGRGEVSQKN